MSIYLIPFALALALLSATRAFADTAATAAKTPDYWVYVGTFGNKGIFLFKLDSATGTLTAQGIAAKENDPNFLAANPSGTVVYSVANNGGQGALDAFSINEKDGTLNKLNQQPTGGANSVYVSVDPTGKSAFVANYDGPSVAAFAIKEDGSLGEASVDTHTGSSVDPGRQKRAFPHSIIPDPAGKFVFSPDLGCDKIFIYKLDAASGKIAANDPPAFVVPPGAGPRHMTFSPTAPFAFITTEMGNAIISCAYDAAKGTLKDIGHTPIKPQGFNGWISGAEIKMHPSGKFLYASVRGANTIAVFGVDAAGKLTLIEQVSTRGKTPRGFGLDPTGSFLMAANQDSGSISLYRIDANTGKLTPAGETQNVPSAVAVLFVPIKP